MYRYAPVFARLRATAELPGVDRTHHQDYLVRLLSKKSIFTKLWSEYCWPNGERCSHRANRALRLNTRRGPLGIGFEASVDSNSFDCSNQTKNAIPPADNRQESQWNFTVNNHHSSFAFRTFLDVVLVLVVLVVAALAAILWSTLERSMC